MALASGTVLQSRYRITRQLGEGGMGAVYEAVDQRLNSLVAIKAIKESVDSDEGRRAFEREASLLANLRHASLPKVIDYFADDNGQFLVMEYIRGTDLAELLEVRGHAFPPEQVIRWGEIILGVLEYLHKRNPPILHRDIKPSNLKLDEDGELFLLDFGLAKGATGQMRTSFFVDKSYVGFTPVYSPLEQIHRTGTDARSDIYSVGATLYHLITGVIPLAAPTRYEAIEDGKADPLRAANEVNPEITKEVSDVLKRAMAISRKDRFASAVEMREALDRAKPSLPPEPVVTKKRWSYFTLPAVGLLLLAVGLGFWFNRGASTSLSVSNTTNAQETTILSSTPTPSPSPRTVQVRLAQAWSTGDILDEPVTDSNIVINAGGKTFNKLTNKDGMVVFDAIPCGVDISITAYDSFSSKDKTLHQRLECAESTVYLGLIDTTGDEVVLKQREPFHAEWNSEAGGWMSEGRRISDEEMRRRMKGPYP